MPLRYAFGHLRWYLGTRARLLDDAVARWCRREHDGVHLPLDFPVGIGTMASDGFHPGPGIYRLWGRAGADLIRTHWH